MSEAVPASGEQQKETKVATGASSRRSSSTNTSPVQTAADPEKEVDLEKGSPNGSTKEVARDNNVRDPNIVDWDGPDDPEKAVNWPAKKKWANIFIISSITFLTPLASSMFAPGVPEVQKDFHSYNLELASFVVSVYVLGYALGPLIIAPLSELYGRLILYHTCNVFFVVLTIICAKATNMGMLIAFRILAGIVGSCPLTIGGGSLADMIVQEKRGGAMAIWALGPIMGPVVGPVAGGYLSEAKGWRWVFWVIAMAAGVVTIIGFIFMRETYSPTLLQRRVVRLRRETGNENLRSALDTGRSPRGLFWFSIARPTKMLFRSPIVFLLSLYMAVVYGYLYLLFTTLTEVFETQYGFSQGSVGLTFLGIGVGSLVGLAIFGFASDQILKRLSASGEMKPEYRLPPLIPGSFLVPAGLFIYGWSADKHTHWIVPIIGTSCVG